jgi:hypothetical protein
VATVLGVIGIFIFIACVIALAAGVTWLVVKLSPPKDPGKGGGGLFARLADAQTRASGKRSSSET